MSKDFLVGETVNRGDVERQAEMLREFMAHPGWNWLKQQMNEGFVAASGVLDNSFPVGDGAAKMARAQGEKLAYSRMLLLPPTTLAALDRALGPGGSLDDEETT